MSALPPEADMLIVGINVCSATSRRHPIGPEPLTNILKLLFGVSIAVQHAMTEPLSSCATVQDHARPRLQGCQPDQLR